MSRDFEDHIFPKVFEFISNILGDPQVWTNLYHVGVYWSSIILTIAGVALILFMFVSSLMTMRHMYIVTGRVHWFFEFHGDDSIAFSKFEREHPYLGSVSVGLLPFVPAAGMIFLLVLILPYLWPVAAIATVPLCFVYSGYRTRKKYLFLESLKGENE